MTVVEKDVIVGNNGQIQKLSEVTENSKQLIQTIEEFIVDSKDKLTGEGYEAVRQRLEFYVDALKKQQELSEIVKNNYTVGNNMMTNFMEEFSSLDDTNVDEIRSYTKWIYNSIQDLEMRISAASEDGSNVSSMAAQIREWKAMYEQYKKLSDKLACLSNTDSEILSYIQDTSTDCNNFLTAVSEIQVVDVQ